MSRLAHSGSGACISQADSRTSASRATEKLIQNVAPYGPSMPRSRSHSMAQNPMTWEGSQASSLVPLPISPKALSPRQRPISLALQQYEPMPR